MAKGGSQQNKAIHANGAKQVSITEKDGSPNKNAPWYNYVQKQAQKQQKLLHGHLNEMDKKKADAFNIGHNVTDTSIGSKTSKGYLTTSISKEGKVTHNWEGED